MKLDNRPKVTTDTVDPDLDLDVVRKQCQKLVKSRAKISAGLATLPVPFLDVAVDGALLTKLLPEISYRFGLIESPSDAGHIENNDSRFASFKNSLLSFGGLVAARGMVKKGVQGLGGRFVGKQVTKYVPLGGSMVAATMSYVVFKKIAFNHIDECYKIAQKLQRVGLKNKQDS